MTTASPSHLDSSLTVHEIRDDYVQSFERRVTGSGKSTFKSHKRALDRLIEGLPRNLPLDQLTLNRVAWHFAELAQSNRDEFSVTCEFSSITNFLAVAKNTHPVQVKTQLLKEFDDEFASNLSDLHNQLARVHYPSLTDSEKRLVEEFVQHVRRSAFGKRSHVVMELLLDTGAQLPEITEISLDKYNPDNNVIALPFSRRYAVRKHGLKCDAPVLVTDRTVEAIETYVAHERPEPSGNDTPLLATSNGQVATQTIHHGFRRVNGSFARRVRNSERGEWTDPGEVPSVTPGLIRDYAVLLDLAEGDGV